MDKTMLSIADGIAASIIATDFSKFEKRNNIISRVARSGEIKSLKMLTIAASFNEDLITLKFNDKPKEIIISGIAAPER
ncbi:nucleoside diphosphate kinase [Methanothermobacter sp. MT-2]|nr:nucleoside diphosphate kinase [Methanothermobacter sp. MT-2]